MTFRNSFPSAWAFSCLPLFFVATFFSDSAVADNSYEKSIDSKIAEGAEFETQWLRLGHYKPRGPIRRIYRSRYRSEADGPELFISPLGKNDPEAELRATLEAFAVPLSQTPNRDETRHAQCLFPARRQWAFKKLGWEKVLRDNGSPVLPCEARRKWKTQLGAEGVSIVFASAYLGNASSMFGHTFLKFHSKENRGGRDLLDYGVNFAAETNGVGGAPFALYGLLGIFPGRFTMQPFHQTLRTYANLEGRDLIEYRLNFSPEELDFFIDHLFELERTHFDYYFLTENCSYFLLTALEAAKPDIELSDFFWYEVIPADSIRVIARIPGLVVSTKYRPSLMAFFRAQTANLTNADVEFAKNVVDPKKNDTELGLKLASASTEALDLAIDYGAVRATSDPAYDDLNYRIRVERAKRGVASPILKVAPPARPEQGHDPARMGALFELPTDHDSARGRFGLQFRWAYHDRLSNDDGYLRGTTLEVMRTTVFNDDQDPLKLRFREVTFLEILSTQPRSRFSQPLSWRAAFGFREPFPARTMGPFVNGGIGTTFDFTKFVWVTALVDGEVLTNPDLENRFSTTVGPRLISTFFLSHDFKFGIDYTWQRALTPGRHSEGGNVELAWAPLQNFEMRIGYQDQSVEGMRRSEWSAKVYQHLLF
ncbi:DUF4105 domain-containing protein [soil metagenome]